jgi:hypothetical protein
VKRVESESRLKSGGRPRHRLVPQLLPTAHCTFPSSQNLHRTELIHLSSHAEAVTLPILFRLSHLLLVRTITDRDSLFIVCLLVRRT